MPAGQPTDRRTGIVPLVLVAGLVPLFAGGNFPGGFPEYAAVTFALIAAAVAAIYLLALVGGSGLARLSASPAGLSFLLLLTLGGWSAAWSRDLDATAGTLTVWLAGLLCFLAGALATGRRGGDQAVALALTLGLLSAALLGLYQVAIGFPALYRTLLETGRTPAELVWLVGQQRRAFSSLIAANTFGGYLLLALPPALALTIASPWRPARALGAAAVAAGGAALYFSGSRGAWLALIATGPLFLPLLLRGSGGGWRRLIVPLASAAAICLLLPVATRTTAGPDSAQTAPAETKSAPVETGFDATSHMAALASGASRSASDRLEYWRTALAVARHHLPLGAGLGTYPTVFRPHLTEPVFTRSPHSHYLQLLAELGPAGLLLWLCLLAAAAAAGLRTIRRSEDPTTQTMAAGLLWGITGLSAHAAIDFDFDAPAVLLLFSLAAGSLAGLDPGRLRPTPADRPFLLFPLAAAATLVALIGPRYLAAWHTQISFMHESQGRFDRAIEAGERAVAWTPRTPERLFRLSRLYLDRQRRQPSRSALDRALELNRAAVMTGDGQPIHLHGLAELHRLRDEPREALAALRRAVGRYPLSVFHRARLASELYRQGMTGEALAEAEAGERLIPRYETARSPDILDCVELLFVKARMLEELGRPAEALPVWRSALAVLGLPIATDSYFASRRYGVPVTELRQQAERRIRALATLTTGD